MWPHVAWILPLHLLQDLYQSVFAVTYTINALVIIDVIVSILLLLCYNCVLLCVVKLKCPVPQERFIYMCVLIKSANKYINRLDDWLSLAADLLELFPDQLIVFAGEQLNQGRKGCVDDGNANQKRLLFDTISKYYSERGRAPLLSGRYLDIHIAILKLLGERLKTNENVKTNVIRLRVLLLHAVFCSCSDEEKVQEAITASQLCLRLLEPSVRDELRRLLSFMATAALPESCRLQKQVALQSCLVACFTSI